MNRKAFAVAVIFFCVSLAWFVINIVWAFGHRNTLVDVLISVFFLCAGIGMIYNEWHKKKRKHLSDVNKNRIP